MRLMIEPPIFEKFPALCVGAVVVRQANNRGSNEEISSLMRQREAEIRRTYRAADLSQIPPIAVWRQAYSSFGAKPSKYRSSVEGLYRTVLKGVEIKSINKIVDIYNFISIKHMIPVGGDDIAGVEGDVVLKLARGDEPFTPLNAQEVETARKGEVVYVDAREVLCRRWNWRECDKTKLTFDTTDALLVSEALPPLGEGEASRITEEMGDLIERHCGGQIQRAILNRSNTEIQF